MPLFEVEVEVTSAIAWYEVEAESEAEAQQKWHSGKFMSIENIDGEPLGVIEDFDDDEEYDGWETDWAVP